MNPFDQFVDPGQTIPWVKTQNAVAFLRPIPDVGVGTPGPTARVADFLCLCQKGFTFPQRFFSPPLVRDVSHGAHELGAAPLIGRRATDDPEVLNRSVTHQQSMFESELRPFTRSTLNDLLDSFSAIRVSSLHNQISRYLCCRVELKYSKRFIRPV